VSRNRTNALQRIDGEPPNYDEVLGGVVELLEQARRASARAVNAFITATYWEIGRRIVEFEQRGSEQARYGTVLVTRLASDLTRRFGRGFSKSNLYQCRSFYLGYRGIFQTASGKSHGMLAGRPITQSEQTASVGDREIFQTVSGELDRPPSRLQPVRPQRVKTDKRAPAASPISQKASGESTSPLNELARRFPLPWSHYVLLLKVEKPEARAFYEAEAHRHGWTVRQLDRQINTLFYERTLASRNKVAMLKKGAVGEEKGSGVFCA